MGVKPPAATPGAAGPPISARPGAGLTVGSADRGNPPGGELTVFGVYRSPDMANPEGSGGVQGEQTAPAVRPVRGKPVVETGQGGVGCPRADYVFGGARGVPAARGVA